MRGVTSHPLFFRVFISGLYWPCLVSMAISRCILWQYVNLMNCVASEGDGVDGFWL